jgi:hypothetical protein
MPGDSLFVVDPAQRFTILDADGRFVRSSTPAGLISGRLADGRVVRLSYADPGEAVLTGYVRVPLHVRLMTPGEEREDTVAILPGTDEFRAEVAYGMANFDAPFGRRQQLVVTADRLYSGTGDGFEIEVRRMDGSVERLMRANMISREVTSADANAWRVRRLESETSELFRPGVEVLVKEAPVPTTMPAYSALHVDMEGNLWVCVYEPILGMPTVWQVFDSGGRWLGGVELPARFSVTDIGADYVLGVFRDPMDVEYVRLYRIDKNRQ